MAKSYLKSQRRRPAPVDPSSATLLAVAIGFLAAYLAAEAWLADRMHPLHWVVAAAGALTGWLLFTMFNWLRNSRANRER
ncbi:MAG: hypothetical protein M1140_16510 [Chloroflexi bacterium]|nr:hypothetical protein [Chloroflexota bacterium]